MNKYKYIIIFFLLLSNLIFPLTEADIKSQDKKNIIKISNLFLKALKDKNRPEASLYLYKSNIKELNTEEKKKLINSFIKGDTEEIDYRTKMTSHYSALFISPLRILVSYKIEDKVYKGKIDGGVDYYFIYAESKYDVLYNLEGENSMAPSNVKIKIEFIKTDNTYKIIGFLP